MMPVITIINHYIVKYTSKEKNAEFQMWGKPLKGICTFVGQKTQCPQSYTKLTQFEDNDSRKLP